VTTRLETAGSNETVGRIAVGVSGAGSNLRALVATSRRGALGGAVVLVFADRDCPAVAWAAEEAIDTAVLPGLADREPSAKATVPRLAQVRAG